jgi:hypothetical protein
MRDGIRIFTGCLIRYPPVTAIVGRNIPSVRCLGDPTFLDYIRLNKYPDDMSQEKRRHMRKRAGTYSWFGDKVYHTMADGNQREVPPPDVRRDIITSNHEETGHSGVLRTSNRIGLKFCWKGRRADVERVLSMCSTCDKVEASFNTVRHYTLSQ